jgi:hypothetical protein
MKELDGEALDAAVEIALGWKHPGAIGTLQDSGVKGVPWCLSGSNDWWQTPEGEHVCGPCCGYPRAYSTDWSEAGPIIERESIALDCWPGREPAYKWRAAVSATTVNSCEYGPTPLIAAMRAFVVSRAAGDP